MKMVKNNYLSMPEKKKIKMVEPKRECYDDVCTFYASYAVLLSLTKKKA